MGIWWPCFSSTSSSTLRSSFLRDGLPDDVKAPPRCFNVLSALGRDVSLWLPLAPSPCLVSWCPQVNSNVVSHWTPQESTEEATKALLLTINSSGYEEGGGKSRCYNLHAHSRSGSSNPYVSSSQPSYCCHPLFTTVPCVVTPNYTIISLLFHNCTFATVVS